MASPYIEADHVDPNQKQPEGPANLATDKLDRKINQLTAVPVAASSVFTKAEVQQNWALELTNNAVAAPFTYDMPVGITQMIQVVVNSSNFQATIRNSVGAGTGQPVIEDGEAALFHYDGTNFIDLTDLFIAAGTWIALSDTPATYTGQSGKRPSVNLAETAIELLATAVKQPVVVATTANAALSTAYENGDTIDGVVLATGDRILIKNQTLGEENGIYTVEATGAPTRAADFDTADDMINAIIIVAEGTANADTAWIHTTDGAITVDTTPLTFIQFSSVGTFLGLSDTPANFTNASAMELRVNDAENAVIATTKRWKDPVRAATTAAGTLTTDFENADSIDGVTLATGDRILIKDQATASENGVYIVEATGTPTRATDYDDDADAVRGAVIAVLEGTANANTLWQQSSTVTTLGSDNVDFTAVGGSASNRWTEATVQTTDATTTNIATVALASGDGTVVRGFIVGRGPTTQAFAASFTAAGQNNGGTSAQLAAAIFDTLDGSGAGSWTFTVDVDDTSDTIRMRVTGEAATTVNWTIQYETITET